LCAVEQIKILCNKSDNQSLKKISEQINPCISIRHMIERILNPEAPVLIHKGSVIKEGVNQELDGLRNISFSGKDYLLKIQKEEIQKTGINSLKIGYNNVFGYYLEVTNTHKDKVPDYWIRKQTLTNAERYVTQELKEYELKILGAEEKILALEEKIFNELIVSMLDYIKPIQLNAQLMARLDVLLSFSRIAIEHILC
jgi:DNA mismatch repair protein MutS